MTTEEARRFVDDMVKQAQQQTPPQTTTEEKPSEPRRIEILDEGEETSSPQDTDVDKLRQEVQKLQDELRNLKK